MLFIVVVACPNDCSGHGRCVSMKELATLLAVDVYQFDYGTPATVSTTTWDAEMIYGCLCDSSWPVGYGPGETQLSEWFGPDCSLSTSNNSIYFTKLFSSLLTLCVVELERCPSGDNPYTPEVETDCFTVSQRGAPGGFKGKLNNLCQVDCSNRGICDYSTGTCTCFADSWGDDCSMIPNQGTRQSR